MPSLQQFFLFCKNIKFYPNSEESRCTSLNKKGRKIERGGKEVRVHLQSSLEQLGRYLMILLYGCIGEPHLIISLGILWICLLCALIIFDCCFYAAFLPHQHSISHP